MGSDADAIDVEVCGRLWKTARDRGTCLMSCPFCGRAEATIYRRQLGSFGIYYYGRCFRCGAQGPEHESGEEAARLWNERATLTVRPVEGEQPRA